MGYLTFKCKLPNKIFQIYLKRETGWSVNGFIQNSGKRNNENPTKELNCFKMQTIYVWLIKYWNTLMEL